MNWFQIVFLREDSQVIWRNQWHPTSCELISNCIFTWGFTSEVLLYIAHHPLWIDFKLYFYVRIHKTEAYIKNAASVVNWFQIVFLREDSQAGRTDIYIDTSCELISNCIFTWGFTSSYDFFNSILTLWIDFKLYFYVRIHKRRHFQYIRSSVVNWFQIVFLREDSQATHPSNTIPLCCELISNCIFTWGFTRQHF